MFLANYDITVTDMQGHTAHKTVEASSKYWAAANAALELVDHAEKRLRRVTMGVAPTWEFVYVPEGEEFCLANEVGRVTVEVGERF